MTEDFLIAMEAWLEAKSALRKAYASCDSSPDYFCRREADYERQARDVVGAKLAEMIDERIEAATGARP